VGRFILEIWARARLRRRMGLGVPASAQEWPPGPVMVTRKRRLPRARVMAAEVPPPHSAKVAFAFFAYVGGEEDGDGWGDVGVAEGGGDGEESGEAGGVVADAGGEDAGGVGGFDGVDGGVGGEDGVEVGGEENAGTGFAGLAV
jgi:hypothetical protein